MSDAHALDRPRVALLGGTGKLGRALARRLADAGYPVVIGTRSPDKGARVCDAINSTRREPMIRFDAYAGAAASADIVVLCVPHAAQRPIVADLRDSLRGKILVDTTVPLRRTDNGAVHAGDERSAVASVQAMLGDAVKVVAAFQTVSAHLLNSADPRLDCDVLVCGDDESSRDAVVGLAGDIGLRGIHAGPVGHSVAAEALTPVLMWINARYKTRGAGIKITLPEQPT